ncbi:MAG: glycosyltransferase [Sulfuritalea sp.]|nr:glycosyltransferase [Sulfuritalea sp.]
MIDYLSPDFADLPGRRAEPRQVVRVAGDGLSIDVSIVTPYYNTEAFFVETFVSLQAQTLQNWEWVIVDDGSGDLEAMTRLETLARMDQRIQVIRQENAGPAAARNKAFSATVGRYICMLDSDDMVEPTYLEKCVWFLESNPEFAFCNSYSVVFGDEQYLWTRGFERNEKHLVANSGPPISVIRRQAFIDSGGFDPAIRFGHEDWDFWLAMANVGHWGFTICEFLQWYRKRANGRFEQIMRSEKVNEEFEGLMRNRYASLKENFPNPRRRYPQPYESVRLDWAVENRYEPNEHGRRILFLIPWMVIGGADRVNLDLIEGLVARGHQVSICATLNADHRWEHKFAELTRDIFVLPRILHLSDYPRFLTYLINSRRIDTVVVTASTLGYQLLPLLRASAPGTAFVDICHVEEPHWLNGGHPRFGAGYQDALDLNVVTTKHLAEWMTARGANPDRIRVMYSGVRPPSAQAVDRNAVRGQLEVRDDVPVIIFAGRFCAQKRPDLLAEILRTLRDSGQEFEALIIGEGELRHSFDAALDRHGLRSCVRMLGSLTHDQWLAMLSAADVFLMPSEYEGISVALLEAMSAGVVPVVSKVGGQDEIVTASMGYLVPLGGNEVEAYFTCLKDAIADRAELSRKASACREVMDSRYSWRNTIDSFEAILAEASKLRAARGYGISVSLGRELATQALEAKRLGDALDWLWNQPKPSDSDSHVTPDLSATLPLVRLTLSFSRTRFGQYLLRNKLVTGAGRKVLARLERTG